MHRLTGLLRVIRRPLALALLAGLAGSAAVAAAASPAAQNTELPPPLAITTATLPTAAVGSSYSQTLTTAGGAGCCTWAIATGGGALPPGLTLSPAGVLAGTPQKADTYRFTVEAKSTAPVYSGPPMPDLHDIAPFGNLDVFFQYVLKDLGLVPQEPGNGPTTVALNDAVTSLTLTVEPAVQITTTILQAAQVNTPYFASLTAQGAPGQNEFVWSLANGGSLPPGLTLSPTGLLEGTPTKVGQYTFTVDAADAATPNYTTAQQLTLAVLPPGLQVTTFLLPDGSAGQTYTQGLTATGGTPSSTGGYTWSVVSGSLPAGLSLNTSTGVISGTPTASGTEGFTVQATDSGSTTPGTIPQQQTADASLTITIAASSAISVDTSGVPTTGTQGQAFSGQVTASGGTSPYTFQLSGETDGLTINSSTGAISGTPSQAGDFNMAVTATDSKGLSATADILLTVAQGAPLTITTASLPDGTQGQVYGPVDLVAEGGTAPYTWGATCSVNQTAGGSVGSCGTALPAGLKLTTDPTNNDTAIGGTPTAAGSYQVTLTATDAAGAQSSVTLTLTISGTGLSITTTSLPDASVGDCYTQQGTTCTSGHTNSPVQLQASGGVQPYTWSFVPCTTSQTNCFSTTGLVVETNGDILGTPNPDTQGTYSLTVQLQDATGTQVQKTLQLTIQPPLTITTASLPEGADGASYSQTLKATGGVSPLTWSLNCANGSTGNACLPSGLTLNTSSGAISGTPTQGSAGTFSFNAQVADQDGGTASVALSINVLGITTGTLPNATAKTAYSQQLQAAGGSGTYAWSCSGLPSGLTCSQTGAISGTTSSTGTFSVSATVTDGNNVSSTRSLSLTVSS